MLFPAMLSSRIEGERVFQISKTLERSSTLLTLQEILKGLLEAEKEKVLATYRKTWKYKSQWYK